MRKPPLMLPRIKRVTRFHDADTMQIVKRSALIEKILCLDITQFNLDENFVDGQEENYLPSIHNTNSIIWQQKREQKKREERLVRKGLVPEGCLLEQERHRSYRQC